MHLGQFSSPHILPVLEKSDMVFSNLEAIPVNESYSFLFAKQIHMDWSEIRENLRKKQVQHFYDAC